MRVVGFAGRMGSGKTALADALLLRAGRCSSKFSFAARLRELCAELFGLRLRALRHHKDAPTHIPRHRVPGFAPTGNAEYDFGLLSHRELMQLFGELMRSIDPGAWVRPVRDFLLSQLSVDAEYVFIDDVRFKNEVRLITDEFGGDVYYLLRPGTDPTNPHLSENALQPGRDCPPFDNRNESLEESVNRLATLLGV